jgi:zinc transporter ZupT
MPVLAVTIHKLPEGMAVSVVVAAAFQDTEGITLASAVADGSGCGDGMTTEKVMYR